MDALMVPWAQGRTARPSARQLHEQGLPEHEEAQVALTTGYRHRPHTTQAPANFAIIMKDNGHCAHAIIGARSVQHHDMVYGMHKLTAY